MSVHVIGTDAAPLYYFKRDDAYLHWTGFHFTDDEEGAWLGTAKHVEAFREHHALASGNGVKIIRAVSEPSPNGLGARS